LTAIAGAWRLDEAPALATCERMLSSLAAYAPAKARVWNGGCVVIGGRPVALTPEDRFSRGPVPLTGGGALIADARIDNREDLESLLGIDRGDARQMSDPMLLARAWETWQEGALDRLVGDFAFAVWEAPKRRLTLARDPFGWRPLHYHQGPSLFAFASMPLGLHALPEVPAVLDEDRLAGFLALNAEVGPASFFAGVERVQPGCLVRIEGASRSLRRWYAPTFRPHRFKAPDSYVEGLREHLDRAVRCRLRGAGGAVASHLSSGWDSSAVTVTAARLVAAEGGRITAFTAAPRAGYDLPAPPFRHGDESAVAAEVAAGHDNIDHIIVRPGPRSPLQGLERAAFLLGRPVMNSCNQIWLDEICRRAKSLGLTILLSGDFGNEGLTDSGEDWLADLAGQGRWGRWAREGASALAQGRMSPGGLAGLTFAGDRQGVLWRWLMRLRGRPAPAPWAYSPMPRDLWRRVRTDEPHADFFQRRVLAATSMDRGPFHKATLGAFGVDHRAPLTDRRLFEFCLNIPPAEVFRGAKPRALARRALADRLPSAVFDQVTTGLQGIDWHEGLTAARDEASVELRRLRDVPTAAALLDLERLERLMAHWPQADWNGSRVFTEYRLALLRGLSAGRFIRTTLRANA
jgi:asparagine synthase (glutamine-hydrolysing)